MPEFAELILRLSGHCPEIVRRIFEQIPHELNELVRKSCESEDSRAHPDLHSRVVVRVLRKLQNRQWTGPNDGKPIENPVAWFMSLLQHDVNHCKQDELEFDGALKRKDQANIQANVEVEVAHKAFRTTIAALRQILPDLARDYPRAWAIYHLKFEYDFNVSEMSRLLGISRVSIDASIDFVKSYVRQRLNE